LTEKQNKDTYYLSIPLNNMYDNVETDSTVEQAIPLDVEVSVLFSSSTPPATADAGVAVGVYT